MPVKVQADIRHLGQDAFGEIAYRVTEHAFAIHNEMGRFLDEDIYRNTLASHVTDSQTEVAIEVSFHAFRKKYFIDLLVSGGAVFELKAVSQLENAQRAQLLNYLMLCGLSHGKLLNFRPETVEQEFVNTTLTLANRTQFIVGVHHWVDPKPSGVALKTWLVEFLRDVGTGLDINLYEAAITHLCGGDEAVFQEVAILSRDQEVGRQKLRLAVPGWAFKVTTLDETGLPQFEEHARRLLRCTTLAGFHWINIAREHVTFSTIVPD